ncbi:uncharacterized protein [Eurosta solidaginis]|uniref:uncharacterized protein n=1 Tax=Eurosta solidaginis TaxID=178769 RepID=UPI003530EBDB
MTNPKVRKSSKNSKDVANVQHQQNDNGVGLLNMLHDSGDGVELNLDDYSFGATSDTEDVEEEEDEANTCSSFSLQECINEFRARRIRRLSTQSREVAQTEDLAGAFASERCEKKVLPAPGDADLINQNRSNKEQERKCKPCRDGFCYCFTSDSGEGGGVCAAAAANARALHVRQARRHRRSESHELDALVPQLHANGVSNEKDKRDMRRDSVPINFKVAAEEEPCLALPQNKQEHTFKRNSKAEAKTNANELTAISRLETSSSDAPLIHIIQELHNNCVISEVRVNKHKLQPSRQQKHSHNLNVNQQPTKSSPRKLPQPHTARDMREPSAPPIEASTVVQKHPSNKIKQAFIGTVLDKISEIDSLSDAFAYSTPLSNSSFKQIDSGRRRHKSGGRLLQKRLSLSSVHSKPRRSLEPAPPKPPRSYLCLEDKSIASSTSSTSPSLREAERILDEFIARRGAIIRESRAESKALAIAEKVDKAAQVDMGKMVYAKERKRELRKSCPTSLNDPKLRRQPELPSCPLLSDLERSALDSTKKYTNYEKNIRRIAEKPTKELSFGWKEPKISEMLNCDITTQRQFKSQAVQAEPQQLPIVGWRVPHKVDLDTVDGVCSNLASNIATKNTPVKSAPISTPKKSRDSQKFIWSEQWRNLSPWCNKQSKGGDRTNKSNLKSSSRSLLRSSKKKILRLVTPKRDNLRNDNHRSYTAHSIGVQTSQDELQHQPSYEPSGTPQSPPGSYHSAVQTSTQTTTTPTCSQNTNGTEVENFDFSRTVHPPSKKTLRVDTQRKLNFPLGGCVGVTSYDHGTLSSAMKTKTYRSYHGDLDQDVTLSKLGYILGNIRAKLEASDEHAIRTFQEIERREQHAAGLDFTDGPSRRPQKLPVRERIHHQHEPIYSEIEEDSIHIMGTPHFDNNTTCAKPIPAADKPDLEVLYARVNKANKKPKCQYSSPPAPSTPIALGKVLHDSLRSLIPPSYLTQLPTLPELSGSDTSYMSPPQPHATDTSITLSHCQSLNNVRLQEQHSPPKRDRNLNKSDLSLHRSAIFLDNLCRSELIVGQDEMERTEKMNNNDLNQSCSSLRTDSIGQINTYRHFSTSTPTPNDSISYDTPNDADFENESQAVINSQLGLSLTNESMTSGGQNSPKKRNAPKFTTKSLLSTQRSSNHNLSAENAFTMPSTRRQLQSSSCPATPQKTKTTNYGTQPPHTSSLSELHKVTTIANVEQTFKPTQQQQHSTPNASLCDEILHRPAGTAATCIEKHSSNNNFARYQRLKDVLRKSFKCSKKFVRNETRRLSSSFNFPAPNLSILRIKNNAHNETDPQMHAASSSYDLDALFALDEQAPVVEQLAQAVTICRQLPDVEISPEMVEAERLLLFSRLRRETWPERRSNLHVRTGAGAATEHTQRFYVDSMRLPIKMDVNTDFFFNYFYIVTFECGGVIKSTQSAECHNGQAIFSECGIEFVCGLAHEVAEMHCEVFMLRLRKVSTLSLEPRRPIKLPTLRTPGTASSSSSGDEIVSRFRLHASFTINARDFLPYEYVECESQTTNKLCLRAKSKNCTLPLTQRTKSTNIATEIELCGRAELRFPKQKYNGFLNVQDPHTLHNWNRRWCVLNGIHLGVWADENQNDDKLLLTLDMRTNVQTLPLQMAPRELCARARAFCLQCSLQKGGEEVDTAAVFFAADTQNELEMWLEQLNAVSQFVNKWLRPAEPTAEEVSDVSE